MASNLSLPELYKYTWRVTEFLSKFQSGQEFELLDGIKVGIVYSPSIEEWIRTEQKAKLLGSVLQGNNGKYYKFSDLRKTAEFGGRGAGFSIRNEVREINSINKQILEIQNQTLKFTIPLVIASNTYDITLCSKVGGNPKADFSLSNKDGKEIVWISHKKGNDPDHFQQYSGMTEPIIKDHYEVKSFISTIYDNFPSGLQPKTCVGRKINDIDLQMKSIYGNKYNTMPFCEQNVTCVVQGEIQLKRSDNYYSMESNNFHSNGEILDGKYEPTLITRYSTDRNQFGISNSRFLIVPAEGRRINQYV